MRKRRFPARLLALVLLLSLARVPAHAALVPNDETLFTAQSAAEAIRQVEGRFSIRITDNTRNGIDLSVMEHLEEALNFISFDLFQEAVDVLRAKYGITVEIRFSNYANQGYAGLTTLALSSQPGHSYCTIELVQNPSRFANSGTDTDVMVHELAHLLHYVAEYIWDSTELKDQFYQLNGDILYYEDYQGTGVTWAEYLGQLQPVLSRYFVNDYAATNYYEDVATLLQAISMDGQRWEAVLLDSGSQVLLGKYRALTRLLTSHLKTASASPLLQLLPDEWAVSGWLEARALGLVPEELDHAYTGAITRGEFCQLITALLETVWGEKPAILLARRGYELTTPFADTDRTDVAVLYILGIINGKSSTRFVPEDPITRQEAAKMLALTAQAVAGEGALTGTVPAFQDAGRFASWAVEFIRQVSAAGVMEGTGNGYFSPAGTYTRQQSFLTSLRLYELLTAQADGANVNEEALEETLPAA